MLAVFIAGLALSQDPLPPGAVLRLGKARTDVPVYQGRIWALAFSPDGALLASGDERVRIWDLKTRRELLSFGAGPDQTHEVGAVAFSPDGKTLATGTTRGTIHFWEPLTGKALKRWEAVGVDRVFVTALAYAGDGLRLAGLEMDSRAVVWDVATGREEIWFPHKGARALGFSADGKTLATAGQGDGRLRVWDVPAGKERVQLDGGSRLALSSDGRTIAYEDQGVKISVGGKDPRPLPIRQKDIRGVALSPDAKSVAVAGDRRITIWDVASTSSTREFATTSLSAAALAFSPDGTSVAFGRHMAIELLDVATGTADVLSRLKPGRHEAPVVELAFSPDGRTLATGSEDSSVRLWDASTGNETRRLPGSFWRVNALAYSPDGKTLAVSDIGDVTLWDAETGVPGRTFGAHDLIPEALAFDGRTLLAMGAFGTFGRWNVADGSNVLLRKGAPPKGAKFSPDGRWLAVGKRVGLEKGTNLELLDVETFKPLATFQGDDRRARRIVFTPDARLLAWGCGDRAFVTEIASGLTLLRIQKEEHIGCVRDGGLAFSPDGNFLATAGDDERVVVWDLSSGQEVMNVDAVDGPGAALAFSPDGTRLASANYGTTVLLWNAPRKIAPKDRPSLDRLWEGLREGDPRKARVAIEGMISWGAEAVDFLKKLPRRPTPDAERVKGLIADLDVDQLRDLGSDVENALREAGRPELKGVLRAIEGPVATTPEDLRQARSIEVLERIGTPEARQALARMLGGANPRAARQAKDALLRLDRQP